MGLDDLRISTKVLLPAATLAMAVLGRTGKATAVSHALKTEIGGLVQVRGRFQVTGGCAAGAAPMRRAG